MYELSVGKINIIGKKMPPPAKRITLHQKGLKILGARIIRHDKKGNHEFTVSRINHLPTMEQVRMHTNETLFPGAYEVTVLFQGGSNDTASPKRQQFPCIDEPQAWAKSQITII